MTGDGADDKGQDLGMSAFIWLETTLELVQHFGPV